MSTPPEQSLEGRLREIGLDPADFGDPSKAWRRLHERIGRRATLIDRYALEAASRGVDPDALDGETRARLTRELLAVHEARAWAERTGWTVDGDPAGALP